MPQLKDLTGKRFECLLSKGSIIESLKEENTSGGACVIAAGRQWQVDAI